MTGRSRKSANAFRAVIVSTSIMKFFRLLISAIIVSLALPSLHAASDAAQEFERLTAERDKALAAAAEPIYRRYQTDLEELLRRATEADDFAMILRIKKELKSISTKAEMVGAWNFINHTDGVKAVVEFNPDNTFLWNGKKVGTWEVNEKQVVITHHNRGGHQDYYNLPVRDGKLDGTNTPNQKISITRKTE